MAKQTFAELLVETLVGAGVARMYGVSGDSLNGITDAIRRQEHRRWMHVRHEETAAFAAGAEATLGTFGRVDVLGDYARNVAHAGPLFD